MASLISTAAGLTTKMASVIFLIREYWLGLEKIHLPDAKQDRKQTPRESRSKYEQNCSR